MPDLFLLPKQKTICFETVRIGRPNLDRCFEFLSVSRTCAGRRLGDVLAIKVAIGAFRGALEPLCNTFLVKRTVV